MPDGVDEPRLGATGRRNLRLWLDIEVDGGGFLSGRGARVAQAPVDFSGWLGLLSCLDRLIGDPDGAQKDAALILNPRAPVRR